MKLNRRHMIAGGASAVLAKSVSACRTMPARTRQPNIIFIMADDLGYADVSCYGRREYTTRHIDRLAREGVKLTQAYANSPVCSATRIALITGAYQYRLRAGLEEPLQPASKHGLPPDQPTLPSVLRKAGYHTALVGKWHMGNLPDYGPLQSGYEEFWGIRGGGVDYFTHEIMGRNDLWDNDQNVEAVGYLTDLIGQRAVDVIERQAEADRPFFMSLHFTAPHWPWEAVSDVDEARRLATSDALASIVHFDGGNMETYARMVLSMDDQIGRVLQALDRRGIADNTIVVFTSDNGGERFSDVWPFTGRKGQLLEGGLRVPAIVRWPGALKGGAVSHQAAMSMDWMPTLLDAAGIAYEPQGQRDGQSLLRSLKDSGTVQARELFWRFLNMDQEACRAGDWKYLKILNNTFLFNVVQDPLERANLKDRHPDVFDRLSKAYANWNAGMLPLDPEAFTRGFTGAELADHFGVDSPVLHRGLQTE